MELNRTAIRHIEERRLVAVMFFELSNYSELIQKSMTHALQAVERLRALVRPLVGAYGGEENRAFADGMLVHFPGVVVAARCGIELLQALATEQAGSTGPIQVRIGLHLGDISFRDGELFGNGVNLAARLVQLAPPDSIALSPHAREQIANVLDAPLQSLGEKRLKNFQQPMEVFCLPGPTCSSQRVEAARHASAAGRLWRFGLATFDESGNTLTVAGRPVSLPQSSSKILDLLLNHAGEIVSHEELQDSAGEIGLGRLERHITALREALRDHQRTLIQTHPGQGYRLNERVTVEATASTSLSQFNFRRGDHPPLRPLWRLERPLGLGGQGEVWMGRHSQTGEQRAYKFALEESALSALKREITLSRVLQSAPDPRHFIRVLDWNLERAPFYLECEYVGAQNLVEWAKAQGGLQRVPLPRRLSLIAQIAEAVAAAHSVGVLHKDLKPANVLVHQVAGEELDIRLADFGSGGVLDDGQLYAAGVTRMGFTRTLMLNEASSGTPVYVAPEVLAAQAATALADVYALGVMLYQIVAGNFRRPLATGWENDIPDELLREDIAAATQGELSRRMGSAAELARHLREIESRRGAREQQRLAQLQAQNAEHAARQAERKLALVRNRRRWLIGVMAALALGLLLAMDQAQRAQQAGRLERIAAEQARMAQAQATQSAEEARAVAEFLSRDLFSAVGEKPLSELTIPELLKMASAKLDARDEQLPQVAAQLHLALGNALFNAGNLLQARAEFATALTAFEQSGKLGTGMAAEAAAQWLILAPRAGTQRSARDLARAEAVLRAARQALGQAHESVRLLQARIAEARYSFGHWRQAERLLSPLTRDNAAHAVANRGTGIDVATRHAEVLLHLGELDRAEQVLREFIARPGQEQESTALVRAGARYLLAKVLIEREEFDRAQALLEQAAKVLLAWEGAGSRLFAVSVDAMQAGLWLRRGEIDAAIARFESTLATMETLPQVTQFGGTAIYRLQLGQAYRAAGRLDEAEQTLQHALALYAEKFSAAHPLAQASRIELAELHLDRQQLNEAVAMLDQVDHAVLARIGPDHPLQAAWLQAQARVFMLERRIADAELNLREALRILSLRYGTTHTRTRGTREKLERLTTP